MKKKYTYTVHIPCSIFILGEHSVLNGEKAIVTSINKRIKMEIKEIKSSFIKINSDRFGLKLIKKCKNFSTEGELDYILQCIKLFFHELKTSFQINIFSKNCSNIGLGSSGAIIVGTISLITKLLNKKINLIDIYNLSKIILVNMKKNTSFSDIFCSTFGGTYLYDIKKENFKRIFIKNRLKIIYSGYKTQTDAVIKILNKKYEKYKSIYKNIFEINNNLTKNFYLMNKKKDLKINKKIINISHLILDLFGTSDNNTNKIYNKSHDVKISGAGLGDCLLSVNLNNYKKKIKIINKQLASITIKTTDLGLILK